MTWFTVSTSFLARYVILSATAGPGRASVITTLAGGTLTSSTAFQFDSGVQISGYRRLFGDLALGTNGTVAGSGTGLSLYGDVSGSGLISGASIFGNVSVGDSAGQLSLSDVSLSSAGTLSLEIGGSDSQQYEQVTLDGIIALAGILKVNLIHSFVPQVGNIFNLLILQHDVEPQESFSNIDLPLIDTGLWNIDNLLTSGSVAGPPGVNFPIIAPDK